MGKPTYAATHAEPFVQDNGDQTALSSTTVCPYCKHMIRISYNLDTDEILAESKCPHLQHFETITGHNCIFEFLKNEETESKIYVAICDHITRKVIKKEKFLDIDAAQLWARMELRGYREQGDKLVTEVREDGKGNEWTDYMIQTPDGGILDYYAEVHNG